MALVFGAANSDRIDVAAHSSINNLPAFTYVAWVYCTTRTNLTAIVSKTTQKRMRLSGTSGQVELLVGRATTSTSYITNDQPIVLNIWKLLAFTFDSAGAAGEVANIYHGSLATPIAECSYGTATDGSGALNSDSAGGLSVGNLNTANTSAFRGRNAFTAVFNRVLSLDDLKILQRMFWPGGRADPKQIPGCVLWMLPGFHDHTTPQIDYSGYGNHGTVTGATRVDDDYQLVRSPGLYIPRRRIFIPSGADLSDSISGNVGTAAVGSAAPSHLVALTSSLATGSAGTLDLTKSGSLTGVESTATLDSVTPSISVSLSGNSTTGEVGTVGFTETGTVDLTGVESTASVDSLTPSSALDLSGNEAQTSIEALTFTNSIAVSGNEATSVVDSLAPSLTISLSGNEALASAGSVEASAPGTASLTGVEGIGEVGSLGFTKSGLLEISGIESTGSIDSVVPSITVSISGNFVTGSEGSLSPSVTVQISGNQSSTQVGTVGVGADVSVDLTGVQGVGSVGTFLFLTPTQFANKSSENRTISVSEDDRMLAVSREVRSIPVQSRNQHD